MIQIVTNGPIEDDHADWRLSAKNARTKLLRESASKKFNQKVWKQLKDSYLKNLFQNKCAYCEKKIDDTHLHVEHYRPKGGVTERGNDDSHERNIINHSGYYWLAYEWYNLILCCPFCNSDHPSAVNGKDVNHPGKKNEFRIEGKRVRKPSKDPEKWRKELEDENPLLLHPYFDDPRIHLGFVGEGFLYSKTNRGKETIEVCDLNRPQLVEARVIAKKESLYRQLNDIMSNPNQAQVLSDKQFSAWLHFCVCETIKNIAEKFKIQVSIIPTFF